MPALLVDLGGTHLRCGLWRDGESVRVLERSRIRQSGDPLDGRVWDHIFKVIVRFASDTQQFVPAGAPLILSVPGPVVGRSRLVDAPTVAGEAPAIPDIQSILSERTGRAVHMLNDISAAAWHLSRHVHANRFMVVTVSSGIGSKIFDRHCASGVIDDVPYAGEIGHVKVDETHDAPVCNCGGKGHLGAIASARGIEAFARRVMNNPALTNETHIVPAARAGQAWAIDVIRERTAYLARVLLQAVVAAGVEQVVVIGGFALELGDAYRAILQEEILKRCDYRVAAGAMDRLVALGDNDSCLLGAGAFAHRISLQ